MWYVWVEHASASVGSKGNKVKILSTHLESTLLVCRWFKGARGMEALSRGVSYPGATRDTHTLRHCKYANLVKKLCVVGMPGCRPRAEVRTYTKCQWSRPPELILFPNFSHVWEWGCHVLSDFSCHMGRVSSPIWELESDSRMQNFMCMT